MAETVVENLNGGGLGPPRLLREAVSEEEEHEKEEEEGKVAKRKVEEDDEDSASKKSSGIGTQVQQLKYFKLHIYSSCVCKFFEF